MVLSLLLNGFADKEVARPSFIVQLSTDVVADVFGLNLLESIIHNKPQTPRKTNNR